MRKLFILIMFIIVSKSIVAQTHTLGMPYIRNYTIEDYEQHSQNWIITQDNYGVIYVGNGFGILQYDGENWEKIYSFPSAVRSLNIDNNGRIYYGRNGDFGYLEPQKNQRKLVRLSILDTITDFGDVWQIEIINQYVYFRSNTTLFRYNTAEKKLKHWTATTRFHFMFNLEGEIYIREREIGLMKLRNDSLQLIHNGENFTEESIYSIIPDSTNRNLLFTRNQGVMWWEAVENQNIFTPLQTPDNSFIIQNGTYQGTKLLNSQYAVGTMLGGVFIIDNQANIIENYTKNFGLIDAQVWNVFNNTSKDSPLWLALNNGISNINRNSPFRSWGAEFGLEGLLTDIAIYQGVLYITTYNGLYYWSNENYKFEHVANSPNSCTSILLFRSNNSEKLLVSSNSGIFELKNNYLQQIIKSFDVLKLYQSYSSPELIFAGNLNGVQIIEYANNSWVDHGFIEGLYERVEHIQESENDVIWYATEENGFYKHSISDWKLWKNELMIKNYLIEPIITDINLSNYKLFPSQNELLFSCEQGLYVYNKQADTLLPCTKYGESFTNLNHGVFYFLQEKSNECWISVDNYNDKKSWVEHLIPSEKGYLRDTVPFRWLPATASINSIVVDTNNVVWFGTSKGLFSYDKNYEKDYNSGFLCRINKVEIGDNLDSTIFNGFFVEEIIENNDTTFIVVKEQLEENIPVLDYYLNEVKFNFAAHFFEQEEKTLYSSQLVGNDKKWSLWTDKTERNYNNLSEGVYTFKVKAQNVYGIESEIATFSFEILPPWYRTKFAYIIYVILGFVIIYLIVKIYTYRLVKEKEHLEQIVKERTAEIVKQKEDIEHKNSILKQQKEEIEASAENLREANDAITKQNEEISKQKEEIEDKNIEITASINYASYIQSAMLPQHEKILSALPNSFILFKPRDIVSGDFYWFAEKEDKILITAVDCTGHGVPGAFMSMMGDAYLNQIVNSNNVLDPGEILLQLSWLIRVALKQDEGQSRDGMDMALCVIDKKKKIMEFSGAKNPLVYIQNNEIIQIKGDKRAIGGKQFKRIGEPYDKQTIDVSIPTVFYIFSDGFPDQFGGNDGRKFMIKQFRELLFDIHTKPFSEQKQILDTTLNNWIGTKHKQIDDILVIGAKVEL